MTPPPPPSRKAYAGIGILKTEAKNLTQHLGTVQQLKIRDRTPAVMQEEYSSPVI